MKEMEQAKQEYEATPIPQELSDRVQQGIDQGRRRHARAVAARRWRRSLGAMAACLVLVVGSLNLSPTLASAAAEMPVLGGIFQVLTIRTYHAQDESGIDYQVDVPGVESPTDTAQQVNQEIKSRVDALMAKAETDWEDYKEAFFATGGTEEEWGDRRMDVIVDYEIKSQTDTRLSFVVDFSECWVTAMEERYCYNLDLSENRELTLEDLLGENWVERCNESVMAHIAANTDAEGHSYFFPPESGGFVTVDDSTAFYIDQDGTVVLVFPEYSIAAGAAGIVEIPVEE